MTKSYNKIVVTDFGRIKRWFYNANTGKLGNSIEEVYNGEPLSTLAIKFFLKLGYIPGDLTPFRGIYLLPGDATIKLSKNNYYIKERKLYSHFATNIYQGCNEYDLVKEGARILTEIIESQLGSLDKRILLPLTQGLDSMAILAAMLNCVEAKKITAFTFGENNSRDIVIGTRRATKFGLNHHICILDDYVLTWKDLLEFGILADFNVNLFEQPPVRWIKKQFPTDEFAIWWGALGGALSGSNLICTDKAGATEKELIENFIQNDSSRGGEFFNKKISFTEDDKKTLSIGSNHWDDYDMIFHHERLVMHNLNWRIFDCKFPFMCKRWIRFWFSIPSEFRNRERLLLRKIIDYLLFRNDFVISLITRNRLGRGLYSRVSRYKRRRIKKKYTNKKMLSIHHLAEPLDSNYDFIDCCELPSKLNSLDMSNADSRSRELYFSLIVIKLWSTKNCL